MHVFLRMTHVSGFYPDTPITQLKAAGSPTMLFTLDYILLRDAVLSIL